jgi:hypothetical protein
MIEPFSSVLLAEDYTLFLLISVTLSASSQSTFSIRPYPTMTLSLPMASGPSNSYLASLNSAPEPRARS